MFNILNLMAVLTLNSSDYDRGLSDAKSNADSFGGALRSGLGTAAKVAGTAVAAAETAVIAFGKGSIESGRQFDKSMSQVAATMGVTVDEIEDLRVFAQEMGAKTAFSASQAADALNYMALAGYDAETSMKMLPNVLNLAAAGGIELADASDMITDAQSALGLTLDQTSDMVDKMAKASSKSNTSVAQLGSAFLTVGGTAKMLSGGTTELSSALGILADNGIKGSEGGTALRNILMSLTPKNKEAAKAFKDLGFEAYDANGNMRPLKEIFLELGNAVADMNTQERTEVLGKMFNKTDLKSINALLATTSDRWYDLESAIDGSWYTVEGLNTAFGKIGYITDFDYLTSNFENLGISVDDVKFALDESKGNAELFADTLWETADKGVTLEDILGQMPMDLDELQMAFDSTTGAAQAMADTQLDNLSGDITLFESALEGAQIAVSDGLTPVLRTLVQAGSDGMSLLTEKVTEYLAKDSTQENLAKIGDALERVINAIIENLDPILDGAITLISGIATAIEFVINNTDLVIGVIKGVIAAFAAVKAIGIIVSIMNVVKSVMAVGSALLGLMNPVGLVVTAVAGAVALIIANWDSVKQFFISAWEAIKKVWSAVTGFFSNIGSGIKSALSFIPEWFSNLFGKAVSGIKNAFSGVTNFFSNTFTKAKNAVQNAWSNIGGFFSGVISNIKSIFTGGNWASIGSNIISGISSGVTSMAQNLYNTAKSVASNVLGAIKGFFGIHSPSTVFRDQVGKMLALGMGEGFEDYLPTDDMLGALNTALDEFEGVNIPEIKPETQNEYGENNEGRASGIVINIYGSEYQDENEIARAVERKLTLWENQNRMAFA